MQTASHVGDRQKLTSQVFLFLSLKTTSVKSSHPKNKLKMWRLQQNYTILLLIECGSE